MGNTVFLIGPGDVIGFVMELGGSIGHCNSETGVADKAKVVVTVSHSYHLAAVYAEGGDEFVERVRFLDARRDTFEEESA